MKLNMKLIYKTIDDSSSNRVFIQANSNDLIIQVCRELLNQGIFTGHSGTIRLLRSINRPNGNTYVLLMKNGIGTVSMFSGLIEDVECPILKASTIVLNKPAQRRRTK